jgi:hypothetical protein
MDKGRGDGLKAQKQGDDPAKEAFDAIDNATDGMSKIRIIFGCKFTKITVAYQSQFQMLARESQGF